MAKKSAEGVYRVTEVIGTSSAVAMVADRPGIAPMNRPKAPAVV